MNILVMPRENIRKCHLLLEFQSLKLGSLCFSYFIIKKYIYTKIKGNEVKKCQILEDKLVIYRISTSARFPLFS